MPDFFINSRTLHLKKKLPTWKLPNLEGFLFVQTWGLPFTAKTSRCASQTLVREETSPNNNHVCLLKVVFANKKIKTKTTQEKTQIGSFSPLRRCLRSSSTPFKTTQTWRQQKHRTLSGFSVCCPALVFPKRKTQFEQWSKPFKTVIRKTLVMQLWPVSKKSPTGPPKPEYQITLATYLGVHWNGPIQFLIDSYEQWRKGSQVV